jgi:hypothetical protein
MKHEFTNPIGALEQMLFSKFENTYYKEPEDITLELRKAAVFDMLEHDHFFTELFDQRDRAQKSIRNLVRAMNINVYPRTDSALPEILGLDEMVKKGQK